MTSISPPPARWRPGPRSVLRFPNACAPPATPAASTTRHATRWPDCVYPDAHNRLAHPELLSAEGLDAWTVSELWLMGAPDERQNHIVEHHRDHRQQDCRAAGAPLTDRAYDRVGRPNQSLGSRPCPPPQAPRGTVCGGPPGGPAGVIRAATESPSGEHGERPARDERPVIICER